ncbi:MAG: zinc ABC transporter substrate-binding protein ZnuA [Ignavibacteriaceae bacterium]
MFRILLISLLMNAVSPAQIKIVTTIHPVTAIVSEITGDKAVITTLLPPAASPHTYELIPSDLNKLEEADLIIFAASDLDKWVLKYHSKKSLELFSLLPDELKLHLSEVDKTGHEHSGVYDPHFWSDPLVVKELLPALRSELCKVSNEYCQLFKNNEDKFSDKLTELDEQIRNEISGIKPANVILSHPFYQYFFHRYGINTVAVTELSPGVEPTPKFIKKIIDVAISKKVKAIFSHKQLNDKAAGIVSESTGIKMYFLDPIGGVEGRISYTDMIRYNFDIILQALK